MKVKKIYHILSFIFPVTILGTAFALHGIYPFGNYQIIGGDFWHQYYPFLSSLWHDARAGALQPWSWTAGAGGDYTALYAYYMASPLNLLAVLAPHTWLREVLTVFLLIKTGCAGLFTGFYFRYAYGRCTPPCPGQNGPALAAFSALYALCAFTLGYYWNIIWFDGFALLPLVALGVSLLMREGKYLLYTLSLGLAILANFYIGLFICIFSAITFTGLCIILKPDLKTLLRKFALIAVCSVLALGLAAVLLLPAYSSIQKAYTSEKSFPGMLVFYNHIGAIMGNFIAFTPPTVSDGLPNLYSGLISILLSALFIRSKKIPLREKLVFLGLIVFLLLSCNLNILDYMWNGFHFTNELPFRFSFLISFTLIAAAYRAFQLTDNIGRRDLLAMGITAALILLAAFLGPQENIFAAGSFVLCILYLLLLNTLKNTKKSRLQAVLNIVLCTLILGELSVSTWIGVRTNEKKPRDTYPDRYEKVQELLSMRQPPGANFYRTESSPYYSLNDTSLYNYKGISYFSSTANANTTRFMQGLGLPARDYRNRYYYTETSPLTNAFLNIRYLISRDGKPVDNGIYWNIAGTAGDSILMENNRHLPLGFMVKENTVNYSPVDDDPFLSQNNLFRYATGLDADIFTASTSGNYSYLLGGENENTVYLGWTYEVPSDGMLYAYFWRNNTEFIVMLHNGDGRAIETIWPCIFTLGYFSRGDIIYFMASNAVPFEELDGLTADEVIARDAEYGNAVFHIGSLNAEIFDRGYALLADEPLHLTHFSGTEISGHVTALEDGLLYTSIPCDDNWSAYINGVKSETLKTGGAMIALRLNEGTHSIEFRYRNKSLWTGITISLVSQVLLVTLILLDAYKRRKQAAKSNIATAQ